MNYLVIVGAIFPVLILISPSHQLFAYIDPKHCHEYNACYSIGYRNGYNDANRTVYLRHTRAWVIVKYGAPITTMDSAWVTVGVAFSMDKEETKTQT